MNDDFNSDDFPCLNEEQGAECDYPFCDCETVWIEENYELPELFEEEEGEWPSEYNGDDY